jgi:polyisoprenoid-binding protein YceI
VYTADIRIDLDNLAASSADVTADIRRARTGLIFVTQALLSESVLDADNHPIVRFASTRTRLGEKGRISEGARIDGQLTLRGATRAISLDALLSRPAGTAPDDLSVLFVQLTGTLNRRDFGVTGYPGLVADTVTLDIRAELRAVG